VGIELDIVIALNTSRTMLKPIRDRRGIDIVIEHTQTLLNELSKLNSRVGLIVFSKNAYPLIDLTNNIEKVKELLRYLRIFGPYPDIINAIRESIYMFLNYWDEYSSKYIIIVPEIESYRVRELEYVINLALTYNIKIINLVLLTTSHKALSKLMNLQNRGIIIVQGVKELLKVLTKTYT